MGPSDPRNPYARTTSGVNGVVDRPGLGEKVNEKNFSEASEIKDLDEGAHMTTANRGLGATSTATIAPVRCLLICPYLLFPRPAYFFSLSSHFGIGMNLASDICAGQTITRLPF